MKLSVIIVNYKVQDYLLQCLDSLSKSLSEIVAEVFVVDNASNDESQKLVKNYFPETIFISNAENVGFAKANNQAMQMAKGDYVLLLNPDVIIGENCIKHVCDFADTASDFGALGVRMINSNGNFLPESKRNIPSLWAAFCKFSGLSKLFKHSRFFNMYYNTILTDDQTGESQILAGAFMLLNKKTLGKEMLFDEQFFMYGEDIDLSYRILRSGLKNYYYPETILHYKGESSKSDVKKYISSFFDAMILYYKKHSKSRYAYYSVNMAANMLKMFAYFTKKIRQSPKDNREIITYSSSDYSYSDLIQKIESNKGVNRICIYHPNFSITI
ncbi:MAG TPA: glycosyltransferase family 2 protein [Candidatus Enterocola sp.]|nr:glycosyltransferase family 2 protein [Candidatus Enterocola sp.]